MQSHERHELIAELLNDIADAVFDARTTDRDAEGTEALSHLEEALRTRATARRRVASESLKARGPE